MLKLMQDKFLQFVKFSEIIINFQKNLINLYWKDLYSLLKMKEDKVISYNFLKLFNQFTHTLKKKEKQKQILSLKIN